MSIRLVGADNEHYTLAIIFTLPGLPCLVVIKLTPLAPRAP